MACTILILMQSGSEHRVLIVDDNADFCSLLAEFLDENGFIVTTACDGLEAAALLQNGDCPDTVITDARMPGLDGAGLLRKITEWQLKCRVFVVTAFPSRSEVKQFEADGATAVLSKPISMMRLLQLVEAA